MSESNFQNKRFIHPKLIFKTKVLIDSLNFQRQTILS